MILYCLPQVGNESFQWCTSPTILSTRIIRRRHHTSRTLYQAERTRSSCLSLWRTLIPSTQRVIPTHQCILTPAHIRPNTLLSNHLHSRSPVQNFLKTPTLCLPRRSIGLVHPHYFHSWLPRRRTPPSSSWRQDTR